MLARCNDNRRSKLKFKASIIIIVITRVIDSVLGVHRISLLRSSAFQVSFGCMHAIAFLSQLDCWDADVSVSSSVCSTWAGTCGRRPTPPTVPQVQQQLNSQHRRQQSQH